MHLLSHSHRLSPVCAHNTQVCNLTTYPHLMGFLRTLGVDTEPSDMSFALSTPSVEWGSLSLSGMFAQPGCLASPRFLRMWAEIVRFSKNATEVLEPSNEAVWAGKTLGDYLKKRGYSAFFADHYVVPMCAAIWSCSDDDALAWPIISLVRFWSNHHLLSLFERPVWRVLKGRSKSYVEAVVARLPDVRVRSPVESVRRLAGGGVALRVSGGATEVFDQVVLATHSDISRRILGDTATPQEAAALEAIAYQPNDIYLHTDVEWMPRKRAAWASWNCIKKEGDAAAGGGGKASLVCVTYWVNLLQNLPADSSDVFVTLNPPRPPKPETVLHKLSLAHPLLNTAAMRAQKELSTGSLQGVDGVWYAGAWCGYGFHEDGIKSAVDMCTKLCRKKKAEQVVPWEPIACDPHLTVIQSAFWRLFRNFGAAQLPPSAAIRVILPNGSETIVGNKHAQPADLALVRVIDPALFGKVVMRSDIGLGEAYMDGSFLTDDLFHMIEVLSRASCGSAAREASISSLGSIGSLLFRVSEALEMSAHRANTNTEAGSARNIAYHYDAGNDFYKLFLDKSMMYSSGVHEGLYASIEGLSPREQEKALETAQMAKLDAMIKRARLQPGEHVLEVGCGWGACAIRMAQKAGVRVTGITVSNEQLLEAKARVAAAGLSDRIEIIFCDYRHVVGTFDKIVSIEMLEAVGHEHLPSFFECLERHLKPGGLAAVQVITLPDDRYQEYCEQHSDFIRTYIFPGGHLPSLGTMTGLSSRGGLELVGCEDIGPDYAVTLRLWRDRMMERKEAILALGYPMRFIRMYEFYFAYCEAGFANGLIHDYQITWRKSHLATDAAADPSASATASGDSRQHPPLDTVTAVLLLVWFALVVTLVMSKRVMAIIGATCATFFFIRAALSSPLLGRRSFSRASTLTATVAAVTLSAGSLGVLAMCISLAPRALSPAAAIAHMILSPSPPLALLDAARLVVGTAAGFAALRAWECVRDPKQRSLWEAAGYSASLICTSAALFYDVCLIGLVPAQLCEAHSLLLRVRSLRAQAGRPPSTLLWVAAWTAYLLLRVAPHLALLGLFASSSGLPRISRVALVGLAHINLNNLAIGWGMLRAQTGETRTVALAQTHHRTQPKTDAPSASLATSPPLSKPWAVTAALAACALGLVTSIQEPAVARIIGGTSAAYAVWYALLRATGWLQPAAGSISPAEMAEWRERLSSTINAIIITVGSVLCFCEWPYAGVEGWISAHLWSHPVTFASIFVGYLQYDLCWVLYHQRATPDVASIVHHSLFIAITHYVLYAWYFKQPYAWLSLAELSTPFLNGRWFLAVSDRKSGRAYSATSFAFAITFLVTRVLGYGWGIMDMWRCYAKWKGAHWGAYAVVAGCHAGFVLNVFWARGVVAALVRAVKGGEAKAKAA